MNPRWRVQIERWLGVDASFLAAAAIHIVLSWALAWLLQSEVLPGKAAEDVWMFAIGCVASSASMLGIWTACGPGRFAVRCLWAVALVQANWLVLTRIFLPNEDVVVIVTAAASVVAGVLGLGAATALRLARGIRVLRAGPAPATNVPAEAWQFRVADLLLLMIVAAMLVMSRYWLAELAIVFYRFGNDPEANFLYAIRCGGALCATTTLAGMLLLLRDKRRVIWTMAVGVGATILVLWLTWLPYKEPMFGSLTSNLRIFGSVGTGSLLVTLFTLLPLRAWGWRCQRPLRE